MIRLINSKIFLVLIQRQMTKSWLNWSYIVKLDLHFVEHHFVEDNFNYCSIYLLSADIFQIDVLKK